MAHRVKDRPDTLGLTGLMRLAAFACALVMAISAVHAQTADPRPAEVEARPERGFGRLIFKFETMPEIETGITAGILVISFSEPVAIELSEVLRDLPAYVGVARTDPDGRAVRLALNRSFRANAMEAGNRLFVDLLPPEWKRPPPPPPQDVIRELAERAAEAEAKAREIARQEAEAAGDATLAVEAGEYLTFSRIVFDWSAFTAANLTRVRNEVRVAFNRRAAADLGRLKADPPAHLNKIEQRDRAEGMEIVLEVDEEVGVRGFREGLSYVVDLTGPETPVVQAMAEVEGAEDAAAAPAELADAPPGGADAPEAVKRDQKAEAAPAASSVSIAARKLSPADLAEKALGDASVPLPAIQPAERREAEAAPVEKRVDPNTPVMAAFSEAEGGLKIAFPFSQPVPAAVFRRARVVWIVFDSAVKIDISAVRQAKDVRIADIDHVRSGPMQILRITLTEPWLSFAEADGDMWTVTIGEYGSEPATPVSLLRGQREDGGAIVTAPLPGVHRVHWLDDPMIGDRLAVVTAMPPAHDLNKPHDFVEFEALDTAHGLAFAARTDDVAVRLNVDRVLVTREEGLTLSPGEARHYIAGRQPLLSPVAKLFADLRAPRAFDPAAFRDRVAALAANVATGPKEERNAARLELAAAYTAECMAPEAIGLLEEVERHDPEAESDPVQLALKGITLTLLRRSADARKTLNAHALSRSPDAALWRGLAALDAGDAEEALRNFEEGRHVLDEYRADLQARFRLGALRAALETEQSSRASVELAQLQALEDLPSRFQPELNLLTGMHYGGMDRTGEALTALDAAIGSGNRAVAAEAMLASIELRLAGGALTPAEAIPLLEGLALSWRGDDVEVQTLRLLGKNAVAEKRYDEAFATMKSAIRFHPHSPIARRVQDDMREAFEDLFLHDGAKALDTVEALALYYGYRELTPPGPLGDEMIRRLADRLIDVDLLDQATRLLAHQVEKRLTGAARAQVATRLAMVHLMNREPQQALQVIRATRQSGLPEDLMLSRTLLEARALAELGRAESAIELLGDAQGEQVEAIKADALWTAQQWKEAGEQIEKTLGGRWRESEPLTEEERFDVLRAAISFAMVEDRFALGRLRKKFYDKMTGTPDAGSFLLITESRTESDADIRGLARQIAGTDTLDTFMRSYRARFDPAPKPVENKQQAQVGNAG